MMMADNRQHMTHGLQMPADLFAARRVTPHDYPFFRSQTARLEQNRVRNSHLSDVVQIAAAIQRQQAKPVQPHRGAERHADEGEPLAVSRDMVVPLLDSFRESKQDPFLV